MQIENEIEYAARKIISSNYQIGITQEELDDAVNRAKEALKTGSLDFSRVESLVLTQDGHTRHVYRYSDMLAPENVICQCLKQLLDKVFRIRYPNRNKMVKTLFNTLPAVVQMSAFTIATVYKGNIIKNLIMDCQSYTKYRPNETTGGIFVSWRRKEELPTGA